MGDDNAGQAVLRLGETDKGELISELMSVYVSRCSGDATAYKIVSDIERIWSAREDDTAGRKAVAQAINIIFVKDNPHKACLPITKAIDSLGLKFDEMPTGAGRPSKFHTGSNRGVLASKQIHAFWAALVAEDTADGFIGRVYEDDINERRIRFRSVWTKEALQSLDSLDAKRLATFLSSERQAVSPSAASCRKMLERWLLDDPSDDPTIEVPPLNLPIHPPDSNHPRRDRGNRRSSRKSPGGLFGDWRLANRPCIRDQLGLSARPNTDKHIVDSDTESVASSDNTFISDDSPDEEFLGHRRTRQNPKFPGLPRKMVQVLEQGGRELENLFGPFRVDITTPKDLYRLLKYFNDGQRVTRELCRASGLTVDPNLCTEMLEIGRIHRIRPDHRLADTLSFDPTSRRAPKILHRWLSHGSIMPWLNALCARAGQVEKDNADGYLAREIMSAGLTLASLLNEFHPAHLLYSSAVERLVRRLWVIEKAVSMERQQRGEYLIQMLGFMGIGQGPDPEELK